MSVVSVPGLLRDAQVEKYGPTGDRFSATVLTAQAATGGKGLEFGTGDRVVRTHQASSVLFAGIALHTQVAGQLVTCAMEGIWEVTSTASIASGNHTVCGAAGDFTIAGSAADPRTLVGRVINDISGAAKGFMKVHA